MGNFEVLAAVIVLAVYVKLIKDYYKRFIIMSCGRKRILLFLVIFISLLALDPAAFARCTHFIPDEFLDVLMCSKKEDILSGAERITITREITCQGRAIA